MEAVTQAQPVVALADRPVRRFPVAVSAGAMALAWARQEGAPQGAAVVVDYEVNPLDRRGEPWPAPPGSTLACAVVLRPQLPAASADLVWLLGGLAAVEGGHHASGRDLAAWWPDAVVDAASRETVAQIKSEVQLGPGRVRSAVVTMRFDLVRLGIEPGHGDLLLEAVLASVDHVLEMLASGADPASTRTTAIAAAYTGRCGLIGSRVRIALRPKGEARGFADRVDELGRLEVKSATGMLERVSIDMLRSMQVL